MKKRNAHHLTLIACILVASLALLLSGCTTTKNTIYNTSYDVSYTITDMEDAVSAVAKSTMPAVVTVLSYGRASTLSTWLLATTGSGAIIKAKATLSDGSEAELSDTKDRNDVAFYTYYVLTNEHVITTKKDYSRATVVLDASTEEIKTTLIGKDATSDLALLSFTSTRYIKPLSFADSSKVVTGSFVLALGAPEGVNYASSATFGIVSNPRRYYYSSSSGGYILYIQHDADINPGSSGGPLVNLKGEIVGINTMRLTNTIQNGTTIALLGMNFAIPANVASNVAELFLKGRKTTRAALGVEVENAIDIDNALSGVYVVETTGKYFNVGDIITSVAGEKVVDKFSWDALTRSLYEGMGSVSFTVIREGTEKTLTFVL